MRIWIWVFLSLFVICMMVLICIEDRVSNSPSISNDNSDNTSMVCCRVRYIDLEGGFYGLVCNNTNLYPINLPEEYKKDDLEVMVSFKKTYNVSIVMWGTPVELLKISPR